MNEVMTIIDVKDVESKHTGKRYWKVETSNGIYNCFHKDTVEGCFTMKGKTVEAEVIVSPDGKFKTINAIFMTDKKAEVQTPQVQGHLAFPVEDLRTKEIRSQVALKAAIEYLNHHELKENQTIETLAISFYELLGKMVKY